MKDIINKNCIFIDSDIKSKKEVIHSLVSTLKEQLYIDNMIAFEEVIEQRELAFPTSIGNGVAIPHGLSPHVIHPAVTFLRLNKPVLWNEETKECVSIVMMISVPLKSQEIHIKIVSQLIRHLMHKNFIDDLSQKDLEEVYSLLKAGLKGV